MSHPFGDLISQYRARKHGLSQTRLANLAGYDQAVLVRMCQGKKDLTGPSGRDRILRLISVLHSEGVLKTQAEANALLEAAGLPPLYAGQPAEDALIAKLGRRIAPQHALHDSRLPHPLTPLIGRDADVLHLKQLLARDDVRVLTLIGPPGVGKTRLALQLAAEMEGDAGEVCFVALAPIADAGLVLSVIAQALDVIQSHTMPLIKSVKIAIQSRRILLVIDNFEHVTDAASQVAELLASSSLLKVLTTSRTALHLSGEQEYAVQPLAIQPATELLIQRAQAVKPSLSINGTNTLVMHAICNRLDRLPLAIELAAARLKIFTPDALLGRLEKMPLDMLTNGASDLPARQQRLRSTIDWSYGMLEPREQRVFRQLGMFAGGFTMASAETVAGADWETLSSLLDKSLIKEDGVVNGEQRFTMLELLREYALEKLEDCGDAEDVRRRHAAYFISLAEAAEPHMLTGEQVRWTSVLNSELSNIRAALRWAQDRNEYETTMRIMGPTWRYWQLRTLPSEGHAWIVPALHDDPAIPAAVRAKAWHVAGAMAMYTEDYTTARVLHEQGLMLADQTNEHDVISLTLNGATVANLFIGKVQSASALSERALRHTAGEISYGRAITLVFHTLFFHKEGRHFDQGLELASEAQAILHQLGDHIWEMHALAGMFDFAYMLKNYKLARQCEQDTLKLARQLGTAQVEIERVCWALYGIALCAARYGLATATARLSGATEAGMALVQAFCPSVNYSDVKQVYMDASGQTPDDATFAEAWAEGHAMTLDQAIDFGLEVADELSELEARHEAETRFL